MSATEELRRTLDERGVEHDDVFDITFWTGVDGGEYTAYEMKPLIKKPSKKLMVRQVLTPAQAVETSLGREVTGETSDGYHTFNELYHHRAVLFSVIVRDHRELAWKSKAHHDGSMYDGMFIVGIETPKGQATYHYDIDPYWDMFDCKELDRAPEWDGHTSDDAIERIATLGRRTCRIRGGECDQCGALINRRANMYWAPVGEGMCTVKHHDVHFCPNCGAEVVS